VIFIGDPASSALKCLKLPLSEGLFVELPLAFSRVLYTLRAAGLINYYQHLRLCIYIYIYNIYICTYVADPDASWMFAEHSVFFSRHLFSRKLHIARRVARER